MNEKGQTLVIFVILLPILILILGIVVDNGYMLYEKKRLINTLDVGCSYALSNNDQKVTNLIIKNDSKLETLSIKRKDQEISITGSKNINSIFGLLVGYKKYLIEKTVSCIE